MKILTLADRVLIAIVAGGIVASFFAQNVFSSQGRIVLVQIDGRTVHKTTLTEFREIHVDGLRGPMTIETRDGRVAVTRADCPNQICVRTGWRSRSGDLIVCVPNATVVRIVGEESEGIKAVTG